MKERAPKRCSSCGKAHVERVARAGRKYEYKGFDYDIPETMALRECPACHEMPMTLAEVEAIERPIALLHQQRLSEAVDRSLLVLEAKVPVGRLEQLLRLSQGYLARVRTKHEPSFQLAVLLKLLADDPTKLGALDELMSGAAPMARGQS